MSEQLAHTSHHSDRATTEPVSIQKVVVVGNGMVGHRFIESLTGSEQAEQYDVTTFSEEAYLAYDRVQLSSYFSGKTVEDLSLTTGSFYQDKSVNYHLNDKVVSIDRESKTYTTATGKCETYDTLVLATGSFPFVPPISGNDGEHCHVYLSLIHI